MGAAERLLLQRMRLSVSRLTTLIESLLDYTRIQSGRPTVQSEPFEQLEPVARKHLPGIGAEQEPTRPAPPPPRPAP